MPQYTLQAPDGRRVTIEANDQATAVQGAQQWYASKTPSASPKPEPTDLEDVASGFVHGLVTTGAGAATSLLGSTPVGAAISPIVSALTGGKDRAAGMPEGTGELSHVLNQTLGYVGMNPEKVQPTTARGRFLQGIGAGASAALLPAGEGLTIASIIRNGLMGMAAGGAGTVAADNAPEALKPAVGAAAGLAAALATHGGISAVESGVGAAESAVSPIAAGVAPETASIPVAGGETIRAAPSAMREAGTVLAKRATNIQTVRDMLEQGIQEHVPGSKPTTFQATGDMGLGSLEREAETRHPDEFNQRRADQNAARVQSLAQIQQGGDPAELSGFLKRQFDDLDAQTQAETESATERARTAITGLGGDLTPEAYGQQIRGAVADAEENARGRERGLWQSIDPDGTLTGNVSATKQAAREITDALPKTAKPMAGEEASIFSVAADLPKMAPVSDLIALRSRVSTELRNELISNGRSPAYARLSQLRGAIQDNLAGTISKEISSEAPAQEGIASRLQGWIDAYRLQRQSQAGAVGGEGVAIPAEGRAPLGAGDDGATLPQGEGSGGAEGTPGVQGAPTFDESAAGRLAAATEATKTRAQTFGLAPISPVLAKAGGADIFRLPEARVPEKFFHPGPTGYSDMQALYRAVGEDAAVPMIQDYAASSLRRAAVREDGTLDPQKFRAWRDRHQDALRALPEEARASFSNAGKASEVAVEATRDRQLALKSAQEGRIGKLMGVTEPEDVVRNVGRIFGSPEARAEMKALAAQAKKDPLAYQGLRQSVADYVASRFIGNTEEATSGVNRIKADQFQTFVKNSEGALSEVFSPSEVRNIESIVKDIARSKRSENAVKLPGRSNTAQDIYGLVAKKSFATRSLLDLIGAVTGHALGGPVGAIFAGFGTDILQSFRMAGIERVEQLITEAMLHPEVARELLKKVPPGVGRSNIAPLAAAVRGAEENDARFRLRGTSRDGVDDGGPNESDPGAPTLLARGIEGTPAGRDQGSAKVIDTVSRTLARIAPHAKSEPMSSLRATEETGSPGPVSGAAFRVKSPEGIQHVIAWALDGGDVMGAARHEAIHSLRQAGLFTDREWSALNNAARDNGWLSKYDIPNRYSGLDEPKQIEEAIAERFADWKAHPQSAYLPHFVRELFRRIDESLRAVGRNVRQLLGRDVTAEEVFRMVERGDLGKRSMAGSEGSGASQFQRPPIQVRRNPAAVRPLSDAIRNAATASSIQAIAMQQRGVSNDNGRTYVSSSEQELRRRRGR